MLSIANYSSEKIPINSTDFFMKHRIPSGAHIAKLKLNLLKLLQTITFDSYMWKGECVICNTYLLEMSFTQMT